MTDAGTAAPQYGPARDEAAAGRDATRQRLDATECAGELLAIVSYLTADDGPLGESRAPGADVSPWQRRLLAKASERLDVLDTVLRGRVAFLVAGRYKGYRTPEGELELVGIALDTCRATASVVDALRDGRLPSDHEFETMSRAALGIDPALTALGDLEADPGGR